MKTPPIPPNCPYFKEVHGRLYFRMSTALDGSNNAMVLLATADVDSRQVIAAVARCAWMDEAQREADAGSRCERDGVKDFASVHHQRVNECNEHAEAWREWGDAKHENH